MMNRTQKIVIISVFALMVISLTTLLILQRKRNDIVDKLKNYIIGDSQTPFLDKNSTKFTRINEQSGKASLWEGGQNLKWLKLAVLDYPLSPDVNSIAINIGTNGGFSANDDVKGLVDAVKQKFPNSKLFVVQGSWGWGGNKSITEQTVTKYYNRFAEQGVKVIQPAIGSVDDPHGNLPIYATIGKALDNTLS